MAGSLDEALRELAGLVVLIPIKAFREHKTLGCLQPQAMHFGDCEQKASQLLAAGNNAELRRLLDRVGRVQTRIGKSDDLRLRALRLKQEGREVRRVQGD